MRDALRRIFAHSEHRTWTLDELLAEVRRATGGGDYSTVFRAMAVLVDDGTAQRLVLGDGISRYEAARPHHEHVQCEACGQLAEVPGCLLEGAAGRIERATGYRLTGHHLVFSGLCPECAGSAPA